MSPAAPGRVCGSEPAHKRPRASLSVGAAQRVPGHPDISARDHSGGCENKSLEVSAVPLAAVTPRNAINCL